MSARVLAVLLATALLVAACAGRRDAAPVIDRTAAGRPTVVSAAPARPLPAPAAELYTVKRGDTLYSIALEHGADYRELAQWNGLHDPTRIFVGQQLRVRAPDVPDRPPATEKPSVEVGTARPTPRLEARPLESTPAKPAPAPAARVEVKPEPRQEAKPEARPEPEAALAAAPFIWPVKGKVLAGFAEPRSKGIDIDGRPGDPVVAAAAGRVTYVGSGIPGLGKLVVIKHDNGYITVYAHNREILVKEQQAVARGQRIAELGATDADRPKLHFQIRKGAAPVDPLRYLPAS